MASEHRRQLIRENYVFKLFIVSFIFTSLFPLCIFGIFDCRFNRGKDERDKRFICPLIKSFDEDRKRLLQSNILICIHDCYFDTYIQIDGTIEIYHGFIVHFVFLCLFRFFSVNSIIFKLKIFNFSVKEIVMIYSLFA